ncbi:hypothetical protein HPP92_017738 [Vanilla planifolia]|uniref:Glycolipid transfer protein domain-containing protein n=1 Tax=Vanilla planifolia TaxID=51239 RepID=A0A835QC46_VANPL|nr:hypothetical protein HPP92_017738 [Vanilla planifolia]
MTEPLLLLMQVFWQNGNLHARWSPTRSIRRESCPAMPSISAFEELHELLALAWWRTMGSTMGTRSKDPASMAYAKVFAPHHGWAIGRQLLQESTTLSAFFNKIMNTIEYKHSGKEVQLEAQIGIFCLTGGETSKTLLCTTTGASAGTPSNRNSSCSPSITVSRAKPFSNPRVDPVASMACWHFSQPSPGSRACSSHS